MKANTRRKGSSQQEFSERGAATGAASMPALIVFIVASRIPITLTL